MNLLILRECLLFVTTFMVILANTTPFSEFLFVEAIVCDTIGYSKNNSEKGRVLADLLIKVRW